MGNLLIGFLFGLPLIPLCVWILIEKGITGYWMWQRPFCICEDCWWSGRTWIHEYAPCPKCHRAFMRIAGFNLTKDVLDAHTHATGKKSPNLVPVPTEDVYRY